MSDLRYLCVVLLTILPATRGVPWLGPTPTVNTGNFHLEWTPMQTDGPKPLQVVEDLKRDLTVSPNTCGWVDGNLGEPWVILADITCFWYSDRSVVNGWATCIDYGQTLSGSFVNTCSAASPYCGSVYFPSGYRAYGNCNPTQGATYNIELTYSGQSEPIDLPIFTGADGISTGTQDVPGESTNASTPHSSSPSTQSASVVTVTGSELLATSTGSSGSSSSSSSNSSHSSTLIGPIIGGAVGGLAIICGTIFAIFWIVRGSKQKDPSAAPMLQGQLCNSGLHELEQPYQAPRSELENSQAQFYGVQKEKQYNVHPSEAELDA